MTKVEIDGKTYCVETLIYEVERLKKDVKASAEYRRWVLEHIRAEIENVFCMSVVTNELRTPMEVKTEILQIIDKYK